jgi:hypothetical protein
VHNQLVFNILQRHTVCKPKQTNNLPARYPQGRGEGGPPTHPSTSKVNGERIFDYACNKISITPPSGEISPNGEKIKMLILLLILILVFGFGGYRMGPGLGYYGGGGISLILLIVLILLLMKVI